MDLIAPIPWHCKPATIEASLAASKGVIPEFKPCKNAPLKASPEPVESDTSSV